MLINPIVEQLQKLKLKGMADVLSEQIQSSDDQKLSFEERLGLMVDREIIMQENKRLNTRLKQAKLRQSQACLADLNYAANRKLDRNTINKLAGGEWIQRGQNLIITGATGTGKSWLACAFGHKACLLGYKVRYFRLSRLLEELMIGRGDGRYLNIIKAISKIELLVLDDWGMGGILKNQPQQQAILDLLDDRYQHHGTIVTSQLPIKHWYEQITDPTFADAILDRLLGGDCYQITLQGPSLRRNQKKTIKEENK